MRQQNASLPVQLDPEETPIAVHWGDRFVRVTRVIDRWQWAGDWVTGIAEREYWLISVEDGSVLEIHREPGGRDWTLSGVED